MAGSGDITVWINSPGGDCVAAAQIYNMLMDYKGNVTVKIEALRPVPHRSLRWLAQRCWSAPSP